MSSINKLQFENMLTAVVEQGGSGLHLSAGNFPLMRLNHNLVPLNQEVLTGQSIEELVIPLLTIEQNELLKQNKALILSYLFANNLRFKINLFYQKGSLAVDLHYINSQLKTIKELGLVVNIEQIADIKQGLVIVSGPFQSGKTTTAMAILEQINQTQEVKIITLEEPIEYFLTSNKSIIQQREVGRDTPSLKEGLKDTLKVDAEVVFIAETTNKEELELILELAEQGRLVITIINANSCLSVLIKIFSYFSLEERLRFREIFTRVLKVIICQKLLEGLDNKMVVANEVLINNDAIRLSIQGEKLNQINNILSTSLSEGMISFAQTINRLVETGKISLAESQKHAEEVRELERLIKS